MIYGYIYEKAHITAIVSRPDLVCISLRGHNLLPFTLANVVVVLCHGSVTADVLTSLDNHIRDDKIYSGQQENGAQDQINGTCPYKIMLMTGEILQLVYLPGK